MGAYPPEFDIDLPNVCEECDRDCDKICEALKRLIKVHNKISRFLEEIEEITGVLR